MLISHSTLCREKRHGQAEHDGTRCLPYETSQCSTPRVFLPAIRDGILLFLNGPNINEATGRGFPSAASAYSHHMDIIGSLESHLKCMEKNSH